MSETYYVLYTGVAWGPFIARDAARAWADEKIGKTGWTLLPVSPLSEFLK